MKKFFSISNLPDFEIMEIISSSINPGSIVLSTITNEFGDRILDNFAATVLKAE